MSVVVDEKHGHITLVPHGQRKAEMTFVDLGSFLQMWAYSSMDLTPALARQLGKALVGWADKKDPPPFDLMVTLTGDALHALVDAADNEDGNLRTLRLAIDQGTFKVKENEDTWSPPLTDGVLIQEGHEIP